MADDKWVLDKNIPVPFQDWKNQRLYVLGDASEAYGLYASFHDDDRSVSLRMTLDDAENFATLILFEVKRARGEI